MEIILLEVGVIAVLILVNGLFSMSELAIVSARRVRLQPLAEQGDRGAAMAIELARNPRQFLSTVQIGITLVGILAGAFGGATISGLIAERIATLPFVGPYAVTIAFVIVVAVITYFSIIVGELIPKSFALNSPERLARLVSRPMAFVSRLSRPAVWLLSTPTTFLLKAFNVHASVEPPVTDEEIIGLLEAGTKAGVFEAEEKDMIESVIALEEQPVTSIMTPRVEIEWIDLAAPREEVLAKLRQGRYSRLPVGEGSLDEMRGYVAAKHLLAELASGAELDLLPVIRKPLYVPESVSIFGLLKRLREAHSHLAIVIDEFGGIEGLVTMHDVSEAIVGELAKSPDGEQSATAAETTEGVYSIDGRMSVFDLADELEISEDVFDGAPYDTAAGLALYELGRLPAAGETFLWQGFEVTVAATERNRVKTLRFVRAADRAEAAGASD